ncbi:hypothetical protein SAMN05444394_3934 [Algoriphagus halophilus]|uniref:ATP synthase I chain n=1 Tax=Algoriphagus halophilus TaxID=226505 RepID=A0A1N6HRS7_9BACT|nr:hypothetical protein SAMN05444394_3934 [Algoriphagus halophilus]
MLQNFHVRFFMFTGIISLLIFLLQQILPQVVHEKIWGILCFVAIMSYLIGFLSKLLLKSSPESLIQIKLLGMVLRIIASLVYITIVVMSGAENILLFISNFFILFLFFLVFDIYAFLANLRPISK